MGYGMSCIPFIACVCPTYKRPNYLQNLVWCFLQQDYPPDRCLLLIQDDVPQHTAKTYDWNGRTVIMRTSHVRLRLPHKYNSMIRYTLSIAPVDVISIWEDDDVYLPNHLSNLAYGCRLGRQFIRPKYILSNYASPPGHPRLEEAEGRFHASWGYSRWLYEASGGYIETDKADFDQKYRAKLLSIRNDESVDFDRPSYVYRWGNGIYHDSQAGMEGYNHNWDRIGRLPGDWVGDLSPQPDLETRLIYATYNPHRR